MKGTGGAVLLVLLALGLLNMIGATLYLLLALTLIYGIVAHPREMLALLGLSLIATLVENHGLAVLGLLALLALLKVLKGGTALD